MLLDSDTAIKVAHDIIHDIEELIGKDGSSPKWKRLLSPMSEAPEGYVDFEFSDGAVINAPCVWTVMLGRGGAVRTSLVLNNSRYTATWTPGTVNAASGTVDALISDVAVILGDIVADSIQGIAGANGAPLAIENANIAVLSAASAAVAHAIISNLKVSGNASIFGGAIENLLSENSSVNLAGDTLIGDAVFAEIMQYAGEQYAPGLKMNSWADDPSAPVTDAEYSGYLPFLPLNNAAQPLNGFDGPVYSNPFYPDWFYATGTIRPVLTPETAWVPTIEHPGRPCWQDSDGIYWHKANITTGPYVDAPYVAYPPRCRTTVGEKVVPPFRKDADGIIVTVKIIGDRRVPVKFSRCDRYEYISDDLWAWTPMPMGMLSVEGPSITQFVAKRSFTVVSGKITAMEYQLLPLGEVNAGI